MAFNLFGGSYTIGNIKEGDWEYDSKGKLKTTSIQSGIDKINTYNGWLAFGSLKLGAGVWKDGLLDGNYRVKKDADAGSYEGIDFEANKLGTIFKKTEITFVDDMANFGGGSATNYAAYAEYKAKLNDDLQLNVMLSGINSAWDSKTEDKKTTALKMGGAARVSML